MSSQIFPDEEQILTILMGELPEGVYAADRANDPNPDKRSVSSSELRAHARLLAMLYSNLEIINEDKAITTVSPTGLSNWEKELFATAQDSSLDYMTRQQNLLAKRRASGGISLPAIRAVAAGILTPAGLTFAILPLNGQSNGTDTGAWILGVSSLGEDTYLAELDPLIGTGLGLGQTPLDCSLDYAAAGITAQQLAQIQATAYTYEVRIYGHADANTLAVLDSQLTALEPARSTHIIMNDATPPSTPPDSLVEGWNTNYLYWWQP